MKLQTYCKSCQEVFVIKSNAGTRPELETEIGAKFNKQCPKCLKTNEYHINNVFASPSDAVKLFGYIFGGLVIIGGLTLFALNNNIITTGGVAIGGLIIYYTSGKAPTSMVRAFNSYKVRRSKK